MSVATNLVRGHEGGSHEISRPCPCYCLNFSLLPTDADAYPSNTGNCQCNGYPDPPDIDLTAQSHAGFGRCSSTYGGAYSQAQADRHPSTDRYRDIGTRAHTRTHCDPDSRSNGHA